MADNRIKQLFREEGQSAWQDDISRDMLNQGSIRTAIEEIGIRGLTSNRPSSRRRSPPAPPMTRRSRGCSSATSTRTQSSRRCGAGYPGRRRSLPTDLVIRGR